MHLACGLLHVSAVLVSPLPTQSNFLPFPHAMIDYLASALATIVWVSVCGLVQDQHLCPDA